MYWPIEEGDFDPISIQDPLKSDYLDAEDHYSTGLEQWERYLDVFYRYHHSPPRGPLVLLDRLISQDSLVLRARQVLKKEPFRLFHYALSLDGYTLIPDSELRARIAIAISHIDTRRAYFPLSLSERLTAKESLRWQLAPPFTIRGPASEAETESVTHLIRKHIHPQSSLTPRAAFYAQRIMGVVERTPEEIKKGGGVQVYLRADMDIQNEDPDESLRREIADSGRVGGRPLGMIYAVVGVVRRDGFGVLPRAPTTELGLISPQVGSDSSVTAEWEEGMSGEVSSDEVSEGNDYIRTTDIWEGDLQGPFDYSCLLAKFLDNEVVEHDGCEGMPPPLPVANDPFGPSVDVGPFIDALLGNSLSNAERFAEEQRIEMRRLELEEKKNAMDKKLVLHKIKEFTRTPAERAEQAIRASTQAMREERLQSMDAEWKGKAKEWQESKQPTVTFTEMDVIDPIERNQQQLHELRRNFQGKAASGKMWTRRSRELAVQKVKELTRKPTEDAEQAIRAYSRPLSIAFWGGMLMTAVQEPTRILHELQMESEQAAMATTQADLQAIELEKLRRDAEDRKFRVDRALKLCDEENAERVAKRVAELEKEKELPAVATAATALKAIELDLTACVEDVVQETHKATRNDCADEVREAAQAEDEGILPTDRFEPGLKEVLGIPEALVKYYANEAEPTAVDTTYQIMTPAEWEKNSRSLMALMAFPLARLANEFDHTVRRATEHPMPPDEVAWKSVQMLYTVELICSAEVQQTVRTGARIPSLMIKAAIAAAENPVLLDMYLDDRDETLLMVRQYEFWKEGEVMSPETYAAANDSLGELISAIAATRDPLTKSVLEKKREELKRTMRDFRSRRAEKARKSADQRPVAGLGRERHGGSLTVSRLLSQEGSADQISPETRAGAERAELGLRNARNAPAASLYLGQGFEDCDETDRTLSMVMQLAHDEEHDEITPETMAATTDLVSMLTSSMATTTDPIHKAIHKKNRARLLHHMEEFKRKRAEVAGAAMAATEDTMRKIDDLNRRGSKMSSASLASLSDSATDNAVETPKTKFVAPVPGVVCPDAPKIPHRELPSLEGTAKKYFQWAEFFHQHPPTHVNTSLLNATLKSLNPATIAVLRRMISTKVTLPLPILPQGWAAENDAKVAGTLSGAIERSIEPVGSFFLAHARRIRHKRTFSEDDREMALKNVKKVEDEDAGEISEDEDPQMLLRDAKDWKQQDHYAVLGLSKYRHKATEEQIKRAHRKKVLRHHPDKKAAAGSTEDDSFFKCIQKATEVLTDPAKRRQFDSVDERADVEPPTKKQVQKGNFYKLYGPVFKAEGRFSKVQPVPKFGDENSTREEIENFYNFWYNFDSWRSFEYQDEDVPDDNENRDQKRHMERKNNNARKKKKVEDNQRLRKLVDDAAALDERIKKFRNEANASKNKKKLEREAAEKRAKEEAAAAKAKAEADAKASEEAAKADRESTKKTKEAAKNAVKKNKRVLKGSVKDANYFATGEPSAAAIDNTLNDVDLVVSKVDADEIAALAAKLNGLKVADEIKDVWVAEVKRLTEAGKVKEGEVKTLV